ncbi:MAG: pseudouridine synthase, partial [Chloroflexi bacterium]|nr:pseudouridine synthase [Chloroflexota bacterium]
MPDERISRALAAAGVASRRSADALIAAGRVTVDGRPAVLGERVDAARSVIAVDGRPVGAPQVAVHLALHKPAGVTATVADRHAARTVLELVPPGIVEPGTRLYPVGRLDRDSEGLLLLTNDGPWAERVIHPRHGVEREYAVAVARPLSVAAVEALRTGIELDEGSARVISVRPQVRGETVRLAALLDPPPAPDL